MGKKKPYYDNNWQEYKDAPDDFFIPHKFEEIMQWKVAGWELPSSVCCIIRVTNLEDKKTEEFVYRKPSAAKRKVSNLFKQGGVEFCVADHESIHHLFPESLYDYEDAEDFDDPLA
tara:strand:+ start:879 stop:1226 length:348 start_codon:yes stop_codon:yes gene_type:complete